jgi:succinyl-CoA synthetase beta subunit
VLCFDAKINFDDNAAFRQKAIFAERDTAEEVALCVDSRRMTIADTFDTGPS